MASRACSGVPMRSSWPTRPPSWRRPRGQWLLLTALTPVWWRLAALLAPNFAHNSATRSPNRLLAAHRRAPVEDEQGVVRRRASGFSYGKKSEAKGFSSDKPEPSKKEKSGTWGYDGKEKSNGEGKAKESKGGLVKDTRSGKTKALSKTKLQDLRDKTLALRQKREAELDEYEEGRALIAKYGPEVAVMPKKVAQRAAKRGMVIGGSFYGTMLAVFAGGILLFKTQEIIIPPTLMAFITLALLALAIFGSSYGLMSASWDEDREGSLLGTEEFGKNVKSIGEGFRRLSMQDEYEKAIELRRERKKLLEAKKEKKKQLLKE